MVENFTDVEQHLAPKPAGQVQPGDRILLPGKSTLPRLVISKETLPDGTIILHLGTSPDDNPDDPAFSDMEQANRVHDAALDAQYTGAKYVKAGLEAYVELAKTPYYEVGGAGLGALVGKAIDLARIASEASGAGARASKVAGQMRTLLARGNTLAKWDKEATQLEHGAAELDSFVLQANKLSKETKLITDAEQVAEKGIASGSVTRDQALQDVLREIQEAGAIVHSDADAQRYLDYSARMQGGDPALYSAVTLGEDIFVRAKYAQDVRVLREELIHVFQQKAGQSSVQEAIVQSEIEARLELIRNRNKWAITNDEIRECIRKMWKIGQY